MKPNQERKMSPEERAQFHRKLEVWAHGRRKPKRPMLVCADGKVVGDAVVRVSPFDPNSRPGCEDIKIKRET